MLRLSRRALVLGGLLVGSLGLHQEAQAAAVAGQVTDLRGRPLAAVVVQSTSWEAVPLGMATTDPQGLFHLTLSRSASDITLRAESTGYQRFALTGFAADGPRAQLRLTRVIDAKYLAELAAESVPARFFELAQDLLAPSEGTVGDTMPLQVLLPALPALRARLRATLPSDPAQLHRAAQLPRAQAQLQDRTLRLLAYYGDPTDDTLLDAWQKLDGKQLSRPARPCQGTTVEAAWRAWEALHFAKEGYGPAARTPWASASVELSPSGDHALVTHEVRYAHWGYSQHLVLRKVSQLWRVRLVLPYEHWHGRD